MVESSQTRQIEIVSGREPPRVQGEKTMKKLFTSTLLTVAAVPFLMAAPSTAKKVQNTAAPASQNKTANKKAQKKHVKKSQNSKPAQTPAASPQK
jgi:hypothetical protein